MGLLSDGTQRVALTALFGAIVVAAAAAAVFETGYRQITGRSPSSTSID